MPAWVLSALSAVRKVPWRRVIAATIWLATRGRKYWNRLTPDERRELWALVQKSKGKRSNLTQTDIDRVVELSKKIRDPGDGEAPAPA